MPVSARLFDSSRILIDPRDAERRNQDVTILSIAEAMALHTQLGALLAELPEAYQGEDESPGPGFNGTRCSICDAARKVTRHSDGPGRGRVVFLCAECAKQGVVR